MPMPGTEREAAVADYGALIRSQWLVILGGLAVGLLLAAAAIVLAPASYASTTGVLVNPTGQDTNVANGRTSALINLDTEAQLVTSSVVASRAAEILDSELPPRELAQSVAVTVPANTSVLNISFTGDSPDHARDGARAFADAYLANRRAAAEDSLSDRADALQRRISDLNEQLKDVSDQLSSGVSTAQHNLLVTQRNLLVQQIKASTAERDPLLTSVDPGRVITDAQRPKAPSGLSRPVVLVSGLIGGMLLGLLGAVSRDRLGRRVRSRRDLERLGVTALVPRLSLPVPSEVLYNRNPYDVTLRQFRNALLAQLIDHRGSVLVTSASAGPEGASTAASLAVTLARSGVRTALVCSNTKYNVVDEAFAIPSHPGMADLLRSDASVESAMHEVSVSPRLFVVPPGADGALFSELLQDVSVRKVLAEIESQVDVVILDVAPMSANADAQTVVSSTQGVVLVASEGESRKVEVQDAVEQISRVNASMLGGVVVSIAKPSVVRHGAMRPIETEDSEAEADPDPRHAGKSERTEDALIEAERWLPRRP